MVSISEEKLAFGIPKEIKLDGFPKGKIRIKARGVCFLKVYVKTDEGITGYYVSERDDGVLTPAFIFGKNARINNQPTNENSN